MAKQLKGDIDNDGKITALDLYICLANETSQISFDEQEQIRADVNNDGEISLIDARKIFSHIAGDELIDEVIE